MAAPETKFPLPLMIKASINVSSLMIPTAEQLLFY